MISTAKCRSLSLQAWQEGRLKGRRRQGSEGFRKGGLDVAAPTVVWAQIGRTG